MDENQGGNSDSSQPSATPAPGGDTATTNLDPIEAARAESEKFKNEYLYLRAEFDNYKKQVIKERSDMRKYGSERLIVELLTVQDILEKALETQVTAENFESFRKGVEMTATELKNAFGRFGVEEIPAKGAAFDPNCHEALGSEESNAVPNGHILHVFKKPYKLHDKVVRHAQVIVAKPKADA